MEPVTRIMHFFLRKSAFKRRIFFLLSDIILISGAILFSFCLRFDWQIPEGYSTSLLYFVLLTLVCKLFYILLFNLHNSSWHFIGLDDMIRLFKALSLGSITLGMALYLLRLLEPFSSTPFPRSILLIDYVLALILIGSLRISKRVLLEGFRNAFRPTDSTKKILVIGAGDAGEQIVREMKRNRGSCYYPVGFVDDDPLKKGASIHGVKVLGDRNDLPAILGKNGIDDVLIAIPSSKSKGIREITQIVRDSGMGGKINILPSTTDLINGNVSLSDIHEVNLSDLLGRAAVNIDFDRIQNFIQRKTVLITGAGGSIGSELAQAALRFNPQSLLVLDIDETEIFHLLEDIGPTRIKLVPIIGDVKDPSAMEALFREHSPDVVLHAAAYKHVPILEFYPEEALKTNLMGTRVVAEAAIKYNTEKFIFISTDKAINPTSIMGASKRASEEMLRVFNRRDITRFISVRFGNVLGSRGSVIPRFKKQISRGGPVTVTHPDMKRYFMITSEAVLLVLEAGALGQGGEVFVLDMGEQVKILDLAKEMISLSGGDNGREIPIIFSQIRPGEKLYEEIIGAEEGTKPTEYDKILVARNSNHKDTDLLMEQIDRLIKMGKNRAPINEIIPLMQEIIPTYQPFAEQSATLHW